MRIIFLHTLTLFITITASTLCSGQPLAIDINVGGFAWLPMSSFRDVSGIPSPANVTFSATGPTQRVTVGLGIDLLQSDDLTYGLHVGYLPAALRYRAFEQEPIALSGGGLYTATLQHDIAARLDLLSIAPRVRYKLSHWFALEASLPLNVQMSANYTQVMRFIDPVGLTFVDGQLEQVTGKGDVQNARRIIPSLALHASAEVPVTRSRSVMFVPRLGFQHSLLRATSDGAYSIHGIEATIGLRVRLFSNSTKQEINKTQPIDTSRMAELPETPTIRMLDSRIERDTLVELRTGIQQMSTELVNVSIDTVSSATQSYRRVRETYRTYVPKPPSVLRGSIALQFVDDDGTITDKARLTATRVASRRTVPIVPFVVFDSNSSTLPPRYRQIAQNAAMQFKEEQSVTEEAHWHYHILNIIGARMRSQKQSTCQLQMYAASSDTALGNARLRSVRNYISNRFSIRENRISIVSSDKGLTDESTSLFASSVVISDPTGRLLQPIEGQLAFVEARLPTVRITPDAITEVGLRTWSIAITQTNADRYSVADSSGELHDVTIDLNEIMSADVAMKSPLSFVLRLQDIEGTSTQSEPAVLRLTSKALRASERATPLRRTEVLHIGSPAATQQQPVASAGQRTVLSPPWAIKGLERPELFLYEQDAKAYIREERQP